MFLFLVYSPTPHIEYSYVSPRLRSNDRSELCSAMLPVINTFPLAFSLSSYSSSFLHTSFPFISSPIRHSTYPLCLSVNYLLLSSITASNSTIFPPFPVFFLPLLYPHYPQTDTSFWSRLVTLLLVTLSYDVPMQRCHYVPHLLPPLYAPFVTLLNLNINRFKYVWSHYSRYQWKGHLGAVKECQSPARGHFGDWCDLNTQHLWYSRRGYSTLHTPSESEKINHPDSLVPSQIYDLPGGGGIPSANRTGSFFFGSGSPMAFLMTELLSIFEYFGCTKRALAG